MLSIARLVVFGVPLAMIGCGDSDTPGGGGTGGSGGAGAGAGTGGSGMAGSPGTGGMGTGGMGGSTMTGCDLTGAGLAEMAIANQITADTTLTNDTVWILSDTTYVNSGATLTIEPCTIIKGTKSPLGTLVVSRGGMIDAVGTADEPIVFTSDQAAGSRAPGDWGGVILLGRAPNFKGTDVAIEGLADAPENQYGGTDPANSSGRLSYVRIEYSGFELSAGNEINGLTMGSVGSGTQIDHVMVSNTLDDGFEWFGGGFTATHLVVNNAGDDMFDMDQGFVGTLQFLYGRQVNNLSSNPNGFECDSSNSGDLPATNVTISNVTLCGTGSAGLDVAFGAVLRENLQGSYQNMVITGFDIGIDARDDAGTPAAPKVTITDATFFGNFTNNIADPGETDNDMGFDELAWINEANRNNDEADPGVTCGVDPRPAAQVAGSAPVGAGLDTSAAYRGAFADASDPWMTGAWVDFSTN